MPTNFVLSWVEHGKSFIPSGSGLQIRVHNWKLLTLNLNQNICCGYPKNLLNETVLWAPKHMFKLVTKKKKSQFYIKIFVYLGLRISTNISCTGTIFYSCIHLFSRNDYYSADWASFNLQGIERWAKHQTVCNIVSFLCYLIAILRIFFCCLKIV